MTKPDAQTSNPPHRSSVDADEVEQFSRIAEQWWDEKGKFKPLHQINPVRLAYMRERMCEYFGKDPVNLHPFENINLLDIGCGGGLIAEPMTKMGAIVKGIDASEKNIKTASVHAEQGGLVIDYEAITAEELVTTGVQFDCVLALEIVEHVVDAEAFTASCASLVKPNGLFIMSTINRTAKAYAMAIIGAEYIMRMLPRGTHDWQKFVRPSEMRRAMEKNGLEMVRADGMVINPLRWKWEMSERDLDVNYLMVAKKPA